MSLVANRLKAIRPSPTLAVSAKAARLKAEGKDVIAMGAGEPDFDTPQFIKDAGIAAIQKGFTKYTAAGGTPSLKKAIAAKFHKENGLEYAEKQILVSCGGKQTSFNLCMALLDPDDEAVEAEAAQVVGHLVGGVGAAEESGDEPAKALVGEAGDGVHDTAQGAGQGHGA